MSRGSRPFLSSDPWVLWVGIAGTETFGFLVRPLQPPRQPLATVRWVPSARQVHTEGQTTSLVRPVLRAYGQGQEATMETQSTEKQSSGSSELKQKLQKGIEEARQRTDELKRELDAMQADDKEVLRQLRERARERADGYK